jgi:hypothetical protein
MIQFDDDAILYWVRNIFHFGVKVAHTTSSHHLRKVHVFCLEVINNSRMFIRYQITTTKKTLSAINALQIDSEIGKWIEYYHVLIDIK